MYEEQIKSIKYIQNMAQDTENNHDEIDKRITKLKNMLSQIEGVEEIKASPEYKQRVQKNIEAMSVKTPLQYKSFDEIYREANKKIPGKVELSDILTAEDFAIADSRVNDYVSDFNKRYSLDAWDYAIAGSCGLFAAMLDLLCVRAPLKPTAKYTDKVNGIFNRVVQDAFNKVLPPDVSKNLSDKYTIGGADSRTTWDLIGATGKIMNPTNHRLHALSHDPVLGVIFGVWDMLHGTCTVVTDNGIQSFPAKGGAVDGSIFNLIGRMFGHLLSDVNAPSGAGNRGMGLPAPFMGLLRMFNIPVGSSTLGKQIEWMYVNGYDFRQFVTASIPMTIMEVLLRVFYVIKQTKQYSADFGETMLDTVPTRINPRFRMILALAYGTSSAVNAGKMYVTGNILNANYASWMGLAWNGFFALKWALLDKHLKLWEEVERKELERLEKMVGDMDKLIVQAELLPV